MAVTAHQFDDHGKEVPIGTPASLSWLAGRLTSALQAAADAPDQSEKIRILQSAVVKARSVVSASKEAGE